MPERSEAPDLRVLLLDDNPQDRALARRALEREQPRVRISEPTDEAGFRDALDTGAFDLVVTDFSLRWTNGLAVVKAVKERMPDCPIIMHTATGNESVAVAAMKAGVEDYVLKSATPTALSLAVRGVLAHSTERRLRRGREALILGMLESAVDGVIVMSHDGRVVDFNPAAERIFGYRRADAMGHTVAELIIPAELREQHTAGLARHVAGAPGRFVGRHIELPAQRQSGERFPAEISLVRVPTGDPPVFVAYIRDVTARKRLEAQLLQAQKMESVGRLAGGIAHDFNNILTAILGYTDLLLDQIGEPEWRDDVAEIKRSAERAAMLTRQLLAFGRRQILVPQVVDVNALIIDLERMLRRLIGEDIELTTVLARDLHLVHVDPGQFTQAVMNLVVNARDAMPDGGQLTIETKNVSLDEAYARHLPDVLPGDYVMIAVSDIGEGMSAEVQAHLFEPFFTTKEQGRGSGLGLSTAYGIVRQSGGHITVYSQLGHGSTFKIFLPRSDEPAETAPPPAELPLRGGKETILLVEDEDAVRTLARRVLETHGYHVLEAATAEAGRKLWQQQRDRIALLLTDVVLPGVSGPTLAREIRMDRPRTPVLYTSGYTESLIVQRGVLERDTPYLQKPFAPAELARKVREVLDASRPGVAGAPDR